jgi:iron(II)-dependent oxidoreductase
MENNTLPQRRYPWGEEPDPNRANYGDTGIGATSAAGCFPSGKSPYGCEEMSGNVWEWTRSIWKEYPYDPGDGRENLTKSSARVLRGGAFVGYLNVVRCAVRGYDYPDGWVNYLGFRVVLLPLL